MTQDRSVDRAVRGGLLDLEGLLEELLEELGAPGLLSDVGAVVDDTPVTKVTATVESAGPPSEFDTVAALLGGPIIKLPVKIHLENPILGPSCFIGSDEDPIVLQPEGVGAPTIDTVFFNPDGTLNPNGEYGSLVVTQTQRDDTFAAPGAEGCGPLGLGTLDARINQQVGLPSPSGNNELVLDDTVTTLTLHQDGADGQTFSDDWHSAVLP